MKKTIKMITGVAAVSVMMTGTAASAEFKPASVRALGMGGSNVASTNGVDAAYWNPAAYAFFGEDSSDMKAVDNNGSSSKDWGTGLEVGIGANLFGPISGNLNILEGLTSPQGSATAGFSNNEIVSLAKTSQGIQSLDSSSGGINVNVGVLFGTRVLNYGVSFQSAADVSVGIGLDNQNAGLGTNFVTALTGAATVTTVAGVVVPVSQVANAYVPQYFTAQDYVKLQSDLFKTNNVTTVADAQLVAAAYDASLFADVSVKGKQAAMAAALVALANAPGDIQKNSPIISQRGVVLSEVGFTYGYAIDESLSVGTVLKYIQADMVVSDKVGFGNSAKSSATTTKFTGAETKTGFGIDLGVMYRIPQWQFGLTVKNINKPTFEHSSGYVYELAPQAKVGAAWIPVDTVTVEVGYDVTENKGAVADSLSQYWNVGLEWNAWKVLAIRLGAFENIAQKDIGLVQTFGLGLNLWAIRMDLAYAESTKKVDLSGSSVPTYAQGSLALNIDF